MHIICVSIVRMAVPHDDLPLATACDDILASFLPSNCEERVSLLAFAFLTNEGDKFRANGFPIFPTHIALGVSGHWEGRLLIGVMWKGHRPVALVEIVFSMVPIVHLWSSVIILPVGSGAAHAVLLAKILWTHESTCPSSWRSHSHDIIVASHFVILYFSQCN